MLTGRVDELQNGKVYGWAFNSEQAGEHLVIRIMRGAQVIASGVANLMRRDLPDAGIGDGDHAFQIDLPPNIISFQGLMIVAQSQKAGEIPLPIATNDDRHIDVLFSTFTKQYEEVLVALKDEIDAVKDRCEILESETSATSSATVLPDDLSQRLIRLETRIESAEVFFVRIDEMMRKLMEEGVGKRKRFLGIF